MGNKRCVYGSECKLRKVAIRKRYWIHSGEELGVYFYRNEFYGIFRNNCNNVRGTEIIISKFKYEDVN